MLVAVRIRVLAALAVAAVVALVVWIGCGDGPVEEAARPRDAAIGDVQTNRPPDAAPATEGRVEPRRARPADAAAPATCKLTVRVETTAGVPLEGVYVAVGDRSADTGADGRASLGAVPRGARCTVDAVVDTGPRTQDAERQVDIPADRDAFEYVFRVDPPLWPVLVVRLRSDAPRDTATTMRCAGGTFSRFWNGIGPDTTALRVPVPPPRPASLHVSVECPGFLPAETDVDVPPEVREFPVEVTLHAGGVPAWGRVVDADGARVGDADVFVCNGRSLASFRERIQTRADGKFPIGIAMHGATIVALRATRACSGWLALTDDVRDVELRLGPGAAVEGTVTDGDGRPVEGALVWVLLAPRLDIERRWEARTDAHGRYRADGIPEGVWFRSTLMWADGAGPAKGEPGPFESGEPDEFVSRGQAHVAGPPGDVFRRDLRAQRFADSAKLEIRLRFPAGAEIPASVVVEQCTETGSGSNETPIDAQAPVVTTTADFGRRTLVGVRAGRWEAATGWLVPEAGRDRHEVVLDMRRGPRLVAQLVDEAGAPVRRAGVEILVGNWRGGGGSGGPAAKTDDDGRADVTSSVPTAAVLDDARRSVTLAMRGPGVMQRQLLGEHPNLRIAGPDLAQRLRGARDEVVLAVPIIRPKRAVVRTVDETGNPVGGVTLEVSDNDLLELDPATTGTDGRAEIRLLVDAAEKATDEVSLAAQPPFRGESARRIGRFETDPDEPWTVEVQRLVEQRVRIVDDEGAPVAGVELNGDENCVTDAAGEAVVLLPAAGDRIALDGYESPVVVPVTNGATVRVQVAALRDVTLEFTVPAGAPEEYEATISRTGVGVVGRERVVVRGKPPIATALSLTRPAHSVELVSEDRLWHARFDVPADATSVRATIERRPLRVVRLRFVDEAGSGLAHARVALAVTGPPSFDAREESADGSGEVRLELPDGAYGLRHAKPGEPLSEPQQFTVPADAPVVVRM